MLNTERRRKCDVSASFFFSLRKANYTRAVTTRGGQVEAKAGNVVGAGNYSSRIIKTNREFLDRDCGGGRRKQARGCRCGFDSVSGYAGLRWFVHINMNALAALIKSLCLHLFALPPSSFMILSSLSGNHATNKSSSCKLKFLVLARQYEVKSFRS